MVWFFGQYQCWVIYYLGYVDIVVVDQYCCMVGYGGIVVFGGLVDLELDVGIIELVVLCQGGDQVVVVLVVVFGIVQQGVCFFGDIGFFECV